MFISVKYFKRENEVKRGTSIIPERVKIDGKMADLEATLIQFRSQVISVTAMHSTYIALTQRKGPGQRAPFCIRHNEYLRSFVEKLTMAANVVNRYLIFKVVRFFGKFQMVFLATKVEKNPFQI